MTKGGFGLLFVPSASLAGGSLHRTSLDVDAGDGGRISRSFDLWAAGGHIISCVCLTSGSKNEEDWNAINRSRDEDLDERTERSKRYCGPIDRISTPGKGGGGVRESRIGEEDGGHESERGSTEPRGRGEVGSYSYEVDKSGDNGAIQKIIE